MDNKTYEEDFKMIRSAIDGAKNPMNQLGGFFKSYAIINMITVVLYLIVSLYQGFVREMYIGRMICFIWRIIFSECTKRKKAILIIIIRRCFIFMEAL